MPPKDTHGQTSASGAENSSSGGQNGSSGASGKPQQDDGTFRNIDSDGLVDWYVKKDQDLEKERQRRSEAEREE